MGVNAIEKFLTRFQKFGIKNGYFNIEQINTPDVNSPREEVPCCPEVDIKVINFDKTKKKIEKIIYAGVLIHATKSCDALKFMLKDGRLDFIEYKKWDTVVDDLKTVVGRSNRRDMILTKIEKLGLSSKIYDSLFLLEWLSKIPNFNITNKEKLLLREIPINFIVLVNINLYEKPVDYILITLELLATTSPNIEQEIVNEIKKELGAIPIGGNWNIQPPKVKNCESIVSFYS